jgi:hypothetical protein
MKKINIEDVFVPHRNKLKVKKDLITTTIVDCELDAFECKFNGMRDVEINTEGYAHITLNINDLEDLISLIWEAEEKFDKIRAKDEFKSLNSNQ